MLRRSFAPFIAALCVSLLSLSPLMAQFVNPVQVNSTPSGFSEPEILLPDGQTAVVLTENSGDLFLSNSASGFGSEFTAVSGNTSNNASLAVGSSFVSYIAFEGSSGAIQFTQNTGGTFAAPIDLPAAAGIQSNPHLHSSDTGTVDIVWQAEAAPNPIEIVLSREQGPIVTIGQGSNPRVTHLQGNEAAVAYLRGGNVFLSIYNGTVSAEVLIADLANDITDFDMASESDGTTHFCLRTISSDLHVVSRSETGVLTSIDQLEIAGVDSAPRIAARGLGNAAIAYTLNASLQLRNLSASSWNPVAVAQAQISVSQASVAIDSDGFAHLAYFQAGGVFYLHNIPLPSADFSVSQGSGLLPLTTTFMNTSSGIIDSYLWDFGDGSNSTEENPVHVYIRPGPFTVTLTASGPGGAHVRERVDIINTILPEELLEIQNIQVYPGHPTVAHPILATHTQELQGYQLGVRYNNDITEMLELRTQGTFVDVLSPEFIYFDNQVNGADSFFVSAIILDTEAPFDGRTIPPGEKQPFLFLVYDVPAMASTDLVADFIFEDDLVSPPINNVFSPPSVASTIPFMLSGQVSFDGESDKLFLRGDVNESLSVDIADAIIMLAYLFSGAAQPDCMDSADVNDTGVVDIGDPIFLLTYLFNNGKTPSYPFPAKGLDPTLDSLPVCMPSSP